MLEILVRRIVISVKLRIGRSRGRIGQWMTQFPGFLSGVLEPVVSHSRLQRDIDAIATDWFVRFHTNPLETFDWDRFDHWICERRAHREAYDRVEALWYALDGEASGATSVPPLSDKEEGGGPASTATVIELQACRQPAASGVIHRRNFG